MIQDLLDIFNAAFDGNPLAIVLTIVGVGAVLISVGLVVWGQRKRRRSL